MASDDLSLADVSVEYWRAVAAVRADESISDDERAAVLRELEQRFGRVRADALPASRAPGPALIRLDTIRALHEHEHALAAYCPTCQRWVVLDLERLIAQGLGDYCFVGCKPRCSYCGAPGLWQLRPPAMRPGPAAVAYIYPS